jgi:hypothetical protein
MTRLNSKLALSLTLLAATPVFAGTPVSSAFTYQGQLNLAGLPVDATADFEMTLWDDESGGQMISSAVTVTDILIADGLFTVEIDFGADAFNGEARWLEIDVRSPSGAGSYTTLSPRQPLTATPYALQTRGLFVDEAGNVGIGTTEPISALHVDGTLTVDTLAGNGAGITNTSFSSANSIFAMESLNGQSLQVRSRAVILDQENLVFGGGASSESAWQSFTAGTDGQLASIEVMRTAAAGGLILGSAAVVNLYEGEGTGGNLLGTTAVPVSVRSAWQSAALPRPVSITAGNQYTIQLIGTSQLWWYFTNSDPYPGGRGDDSDAEDFAFRTYMVDPTAQWQPNLVIDPEGEVAIGKATATSTLDVDGTVTATAFAGDGSGLTNLPAAGGLWDESDTDVYYDAGNVGIGTDSPLELLHLSGGDLRLDHNDTVNTTRNVELRGSRQGASLPFASLDFWNLDPNGLNEDKLVAQIASYNTGLDDSGDLRFFTADDLDLFGAPVERMRITETGEVGIGTLFPDSLLDVNGTVTASLFVGDGSGLTNLPLAWTQSGSVVSYESGNVGIGTSAPQEALGVVGDIRFGSEQQYEAVADTEKTRIMRGFIRPDGTLDTAFSSSGVTAERLGTGLYRVVWDAGIFSAAPIITVTADSADSDEIRNAFLTTQNIDNFRIRVVNANGNDRDAYLNFIAIGPR